MRLVSRVNAFTKKNNHRWMYLTAYSVCQSLSFTFHEYILELLFRVGIICIYKLFLFYVFGIESDNLYLHNSFKL